MPSDRSQRQATAAGGGFSRYSRAVALALELSDARREWRALRNRRLELGLRASLLALDRDVALSNLKKTQSYLVRVRPGEELPPPERFASAGGGCAAPVPAADGCNAHRETSLREETARGRGVVAAIRRRVSPLRRRYLQLSDLQRELRVLQHDCRELERHADLLQGERDAVREALRAAQAMVGGPPAVPAKVPVDGSGRRVTDLAERLHAVADRLARVQLEKNDMEIRLTESNAALAQLEVKLDEANAVLAQQELALAAALSGRKARDREPIERLDQQFAELEQILEQAHRDREAVELALEEATARGDRLSRLEQRRLRELADQRAKLAERDRQLTAAFSEIDTLQAFQADSAARLAAADERIAGLESRVEQARAHAGPADSGTPPRAVRRRRAMGRLRRSARRAVPGMVFLAGVFASAAKIWDVYRQDTQLSATVGESRLGQQPRAVTSLASLEDASVHAGAELPGGVRYTVIRNGTGSRPGPDDAVVISYRVSFPQSTGVAGSPPAGDAEAVRVADVVPGLREVLPYMQEGAEWEVHVPAALAYSGPGSFAAKDVVFLIELKAVVTTDGGHPAGD